MPNSPLEAEITPPYGIYVYPL